MLNALHPAKGSRKKRRRLGRGDSSGHGSFSTRGCKGQNSRAGTKFRPGFEGNQTPLVQRLPQLRGFNNVNKVYYQVVNLDDLANMKESKISIVELKKSRLISSANKPVKVLCKGKITQKLDLTVHAISATAKEAIEKAGGTVSLIKKANPSS